MPDGGVDTVYSEIWQADQERLVVSAPAPDGGWRRPGAAVKLAEQGAASGGPGSDAAPQPLFAAVDESRLDTAQFVTFRALLDNYVVRSAAPEVETPQERREIEAFLSAVVARPPMQIAYDHITSEFEPDLSLEGFQDRLYEIWFRPYTNHFGGNAVPHASGFEHVFVGEGRYRPGERDGGMSGYHSWYKFYLDESEGRVNHLGHNYGSGTLGGPDNPDVVTLQMAWDHRDPETGTQVTLFKPRGGFFVGTTPATELALGTVAFFEDLHGRLEDQSAEVTLGGGRYDLVIYRSTEPDGDRGAQVRSFFPIYLGPAEAGEGGTDTTRTDTDTPMPGDGVAGLRIFAAMVNPRGPEDQGQGEWVQVENAGGSTVSLDGWELRDKVGRPLALSGTIQSGEVRLFWIDSCAGPEALRLGNGGGTISLHDPDGDGVAEVTYGSAPEGQVLRFE